VASEFGGRFVGLEHDRESIPADRGSDPVLDGPISGMRFLSFNRNCVHVRCRRRVRDGSAPPARSVDDLLKEKVSSLGSIDLKNTMQRVEPLLGLDRIKVTTAVHRHLPGASRQMRVR
jgi:hypothetical protein